MEKEKKRSSAVVGTAVGRLLLQTIRGIINTTACLFKKCFKNTKYHKIINNLI